ncbi:MAG: peptidase C39 [Sulfurihydrogenibium sp.]|nr:MAG: peptidase C39 [Sulfurihydrogenibium sp.]
MMKKFLLFALIIFKLSFATTLDVPFVKQRTDFCGPASLSSVMAYFGDKVDQDEIASFVYNPKLKGALITDLQNFAKERGFQTILKSSDIEEIKSFIDQKKPVIALIDLGFWVISKPHYVVIVGYNQDGFLLNTGYKEKEFMSYRDFQEKWEKMGKVILVVYK